MDAEDAKDLEKYTKDKRRAEVKCNLSEVAQFCNCIGEIYSKYGRYEDAIQEHRQERQLSETLGDKIGEAVACRKIGENLCSQGLYKEALELQKQHLTIAREYENHIEEQRAWATIGRTYLSQAETRNIQESLVANKKAEKAFVKALEACEKVKVSVKPSEYMSMKGRIYLNIGLVYDLRGDLKDSADMMKRAVVIAEKFRLDEETYLCQSSLASLYQKRNQYSQALRSLDVALSVAEKLRNKVWERETYVHKASIHANCADFLTAKHCLKKAYKLKIVSDICESKLVKMFQCVNKMQEANQDLQTTTDQKEFARLYEVVADSAAELENFAQAIEYYLKVLEYSAVMSPDERAAIYASLAQSYADIRQYDNAIFYYDKELEERKDNPEQACRTFLNIAELKELKGCTYSVICKIYMSAFESAKKAKHTKLQVQTLKSLIVLEQTWKQTIHLEQTKRKLASLLQKKAVGDNWDSDSEEESEEADKDVNKARNEDDENLSLSDLTVSEESDNDHGAVRTENKKRFARRNEKGETALHRACIDGNLKKVKSLIGEGHPVNTRDFCGWLPLHEACNHGHVPIVECLVDAGAWINDRGGERCGGVTPLIDAANCGHLGIVKLLVERGAQVMAKDDDGNTVLDSLRSWYNRTEDVLELADEVDYRKVEKLLQSMMGCDDSGTNEPGTSKNRPNIRPITQNVVSVSPRERDSCPLPDLCDDVNTGSKSSVHKKQKSAVTERLMKLKQKRQDKLTGRSIPKLAQVQESLTSSDDDEPPDIYRDPQLSPSISDTDLPGSEVYRLAINSIASSAQKRSEKDLKDVREDADPDGGKQISALVSADEDVGDDWLVDDVQWPQLKRKSTAVSNVLTTNSSRSVSRKRSWSDDSKSFRRSKLLCLVNKRKKTPSHNEKQVPGICHDGSDMDRAEGDGMLDNACPVSSSSETVGENKSAARRNSNDCQWDDDDDFEMCQIDTVYDGDFRYNTDTSLSRNNSTSLNSSVRFPSRVTSRHVTHDHVTETRMSDSRETTAQTNLRKQPAHFDSLDTNLRGGWTKVVDASSNSRLHTAETGQTSMTDRTEKPTYLNSIRVKVKIGEQTLLLPIQAADHENGVSWLFRQVRERYFSMFLLLPTLTLSTQDGTILCPSDTISTVLQDGDLLIAHVSAWERPKLEDRYVQACKLCLASANTHILSLMQKADQSGQLQLSDMGLGFSHLQPVFQALVDHKILTELRLNGNRLGDAGIGSLMKLLTGLPHLKVLSIETNGISAEGIRTMASALVTDPCLHILSTLSLSHNCLDDTAAEFLASVIRSLPMLCHLSLCSCNFSHRMFSIPLCEALKERRLEHLNICENNIGDEGLQNLLLALHPGFLRELNISHTRSASDQDIFPYLQDFFSRGPCRLLELSLAGNYLSPADVSFINRLPMLAKSLRCLILSQNHNVNNKSLQKLLYLSTDKSCVLEEITARGCSVTSPLDSELVEAIRSKMSCYVPLKKFIFTCRGLKATDSQALRELWLNTWKDEGQVKADGMTVSLTVVLSEG